MKLFSRRTSAAVHVLIPVAACMMSLVHANEPSEEALNSVLEPTWTDIQNGEGISLLDLLVSLRTDWDTELELDATWGMLGEIAKTQLGAMCQVSGTTQSCMRIDKHSSTLASMCGVQHATVDCMFYSEDIMQLGQTPIDVFMAQFSGAVQLKLQLDCPECMRNLQALWCAQALPKCGTFNRMLNETLLPLSTHLRSHLLLQQQQQQPAQVAKGPALVAAPQESLPLLLPPTWLQALQDNLTRYLPCRSMCEAVVATCTCGKAPGPLVGPSIQALIQGPAVHSFLHPSGTGNFTGTPSAVLPAAGATRATHVASSTAQSILQQAIEGAERDVPLCSWFPDEEHPQFAGHCVQLPSSCLRKDWCTNIVQAVDIPISGSVFSWHHHQGGPHGDGAPSSAQGSSDAALETVNVTLPAEVMLGAVFKTVFGWRLPAAADAGTGLRANPQPVRVYKAVTPMVTIMRVLCALSMLGMLGLMLWCAVRALSHMLHQTLSVRPGEHYYIQLDSFELREGPPHSSGHSRHSVQ